MADAKTTLQSIENHLTKAWDKLEEKGATIPQDRNTKNLREAILSIGGGIPDPSDKTINALKRALSANVAEEDEYFPIGQEVVDPTAPNNPWIVMHYGPAKDATTGSDINGAFLCKKYFVNRMRYRPSGGDISYSDSVMREYIEGEFYQSLSSDYKNAITKISIPYNPGTGATEIDANVWLMVPAEIMGVGTLSSPFDYWKKKTGLLVQSNAANTGRVLSTVDGTTGALWSLRTAYSTTNTYYVDADGSIKYGTANTTDNFGVMPAIFVGDNDFVPKQKSLTELKETLKAGNAQDKYPIGTEIPDTWNGNSNPLIVAHYLNSSNNERYNGAIGVILIRKYVEPTSMAYGDNQSYANSTVRNYLDTTYLNNSSDELKSLISPIGGIIGGASTANWFLMHSTEVNGIASSSYDSYPVWDYWKQVTGLSSPTNDANSGRIVRSKSGTSTTWLRNFYGLNNPYTISATGGILSAYYTNSQYGILPACFISKN